ncbi:MAG: glycosyltransferase family 4 protein [Methylococcaceae bacterium]
MKKISFFCGDINRTGGTERVTTLIANALVKQGYDVSILSTANGLNPFFETAKEIKIYSLHMENHSSNFSNIKIIKNLHHYLVSNAIDYLIDVDIVLSFYSIPASFKTKTKIISWEHFNYYISVGGIIQRCKRKIGRMLARKFAWAIVTLTKKDKINYERQLSSAQIITIYNPAPVINYSNPNYGCNNVLAIGRLTYQKGFDTLLTVWQIVCKTNNNWMLYIVGSGQDEQALKQQTQNLGISNRVIFVANTKNIEQYYLNAAIYIMSSRFEGLPMVLLEAKKYGLPIISFDCETGPSDIVQHEIDGILVENNNTYKLADSLLQLINNAEKRALFSKNALQDNRFELSTIIEQWQKILI